MWLFRCRVVCVCDLPSYFCSPQTFRIKPPMCITMADAAFFLSVFNKSIQRFMEKRWAQSSAIVIVGFLPFITLKPHPFLHHHKFSSCGCSGKKMHDAELTINLVNYGTRTWFHSNLSWLLLLNVNAIKSLCCVILSNISSWWLELASIDWNHPHPKLARVTVLLIHRQLVFIVSDLYRCTVWRLVSLSSGCHITVSDDSRRDVRKSAKNWTIGKRDAKHLWWVDNTQ